MQSNNLFQIGLVCVAKLCISIYIDGSRAVCRISLSFRGSKSTKVFISLTLVLVCLS